MASFPYLHDFCTAAVIQCIFVVAAETVVVRIFYIVNRGGNGKLTFKEYCRSHNGLSLGWASPPQSSPTPYDLAAHVPPKSCCICSFFLRKDFVIAICQFDQRSICGQNYMKTSSKTLAPGGYAAAGH